MKKYIHYFSSKLKGSTLGGILLLSGSCIGVGMLTLPTVTGIAGFIPALVLSIICWIFIIAFALLIVELLLQHPTRFSFTSLAEQTLGKWGRILIEINFLLLFYSLIISYLVKGGELVQKAFFPTIQQEWLGSLMLSIIIGISIGISTRFVDNFNRICMFGLFVAYIYLLTLGKQEIHWNFLNYQRWNLSIIAIPFMIIAFGFHNMIPTIKEYVGANPTRLIKTILIGGAIPLIIYLLWIFHVLTIVPPTGKISILNSFLKGQISTEPLSILVLNRYLSITIQFFAFFAIITSLFGQALSVLDFIADATKIPRTPLHRYLISSLIFVPTFFMSQMDPNLFFKILELAGGILAITLFGILPVLMVWRSRYYYNHKKPIMIPGGKFSLVLILLFSILVLGYEIAKLLGVEILSLFMKQQL